MKLHRGTPVAFNEYQIFGVVRSVLGQECIIELQTGKVFTVSRLVAELGAMSLKPLEVRCD